jgi:DNA polymerase III subunit gamma/tau
VSYLVLARKWRPQTFDDLVGQSHVSQTLANAINANRVAHAFLFTGVRGVGKTTSARIMAKAMNCLKGPTATPCLQCPPCLEIAAGTDVDVQEIDGASYNGVDEVRKLQETLAYRPARDRYKIFIVDEVHMLSQSAWNAFLKTLEEPPPHVKFIFATTEVHKVPVTILSRCQRYDFKLIPAQLIAKQIKKVLESETIEADDAAIALIAREAAGSMRDAMSLLDQAIAWGGTKLAGEEVSRVLGVAGRSVLTDITRALLAGDAPTCLAIVAMLADQGHDIAHLGRDILLCLRDMVVLKVVKDPGELLDLTAEEAESAAEIARGADGDDLVRLHHGFSRAYDDIVRSFQPRAALEMALVRLSKRPPLIPIDDLVSRLADLERRLGDGPSPPPGPGGSAKAGPASRPASSSAAARSAPIPARKGPVATGPVDLDAWRAVLDKIRSIRPALASVLEHAAPLMFAPDRVVLGYEPDSLLTLQATERAAVDLLTRVVQAHFQTSTEIAFDLDAEARTVPSIAAINGEKERARLEAARQAIVDHPLVRAAIDILGAELKDVRTGD